jgi:hypothetical protein
MQLLKTVYGEVATLVLDESQLDSSGGLGANRLREVEVP